MVRVVEGDWGLHQLTEKSTHDWILVHKDAELTIMFNYIVETKSSMLFQPETGTEMKFGYLPKHIEHYIRNECQYS